MSSFRFNKGPRQTGLSAIAHPYADTEIKLNGKRVGLIGAPSRFRGKGWDVRFVVKQEPTDADPCPWRWAFLKGDYQTEKEARTWVIENAERIMTKLDLANLDD